MRGALLSIPRKKKKRTERQSRTLREKRMALGVED